MHSRRSFITLPHSSMCSETGTEYGMGGSAWLLGLSDRLVREVTTGVAGSSLTGMGVAKGAGMHCALDRSAGAKGQRSPGNKRQRRGSAVSQLILPGPMLPRNSNPFDEICRK